jgi:hypothetical protein
LKKENAAEVEKAKLGEIGDLNGGANKPELPLG